MDGAVEKFLLSCEQHFHNENSLEYCLESLEALYRQFTASTGVFVINYHQQCLGYLARLIAESQEHMELVTKSLKLLLGLVKNPELLVIIQKHHVVSVIAGVVTKHTLSKEALTCALHFLEKVTCSKMQSVIHLDQLIGFLVSLLLQDKELEVVVPLLTNILKHHTPARQYIRMMKNSHHIWTKLIELLSTDDPLNVILASSIMTYLALADRQLCNKWLGVRHVSSASQMAFSALSHPASSYNTWRYAADLLITLVHNEYTRSLLTDLPRCLQGIACQVENAPLGEKAMILEFLLSCWDNPQLQTKLYSLFSSNDYQFCRVLVKVMASADAAGNCSAFAAELVCKIIKATDVGSGLFNVPLLDDINSVLCIEGDCKLSLAICRRNYFALCIINDLLERTQDDSFHESVFNTLNLDVLYSLISKQLLSNFTSLDAVKMIVSSLKVLLLAKWRADRIASLMQSAEVHQLLVSALLSHCTETIKMALQIVQLSSISLESLASMMARHVEIDADPSLSNSRNRNDSVTSDSGIIDELANSLHTSLSFRNNIIEDNNVMKMYHEELTQSRLQACKLEAALSLSNNKVEQLQNSLSNQLDTYSKLHTEKFAIEHLLSEGKKLNKTMEINLADINKKYVSLSELHKTSTANFDKELSTVMSKVHLLEKSLAEKEENCRYLFEQKEEISQQNSQLKSKLDTEQKKYKQLEKQREVLVKDCEDKLVLIQDLRAQMKMKELEFERKEEERDKVFEEAIANTGRELDDEKRISASLKSKVTKLEADLERHKEMTEMIRNISSGNIPPAKRNK